MLTKLTCGRVMGCVRGCGRVYRGLSLGLGEVRLGLVALAVKFV